MSLKLSFELPGDVRYVSAVRAAADSFLHLLSVNEDDIDDVTIVIGELCTNAAQHAHLHKEGLYMVEITYSTGYVDIKVIDKGSGFNRDALPEPDFNKEEGRGIWLVELLSEKVDFKGLNEGGMSVNARLKLRHNYYSQNTSLLC